MDKKLAFAPVWIYLFFKKVFLDDLVISFEILDFVCFSLIVE